MCKKIALNTKEKALLIVQINDIIYFEKQDKFIKIVFNNTNKCIYIKMSMKNLQKTLEYNQIYNNFFIKIHCSYIVNLNHIKAIMTKKTIMSNNIVLPLSYSNKNVLVKLIYKHCYILDNKDKYDEEI